MEQKTKKKPESVKKYLIKNIIFTVVGIAIISFLLLTLTVWRLNSYTRHGQTVKIPAIKGLNVEEAEKILDNNSLRHEVISSLYTGAKPGSVVEVIPEESSSVKKDRIVYLVIEPTTPQLVTIPDLNSFSSRQALTRLKSLGFDQITIQNKPSSYKGLVLDILVAGQSYTKGIKVPKSTPITLVIGQGGEVLVDSVFDGLLIDSLDLDLSQIDEDQDVTANPYFE